MNEQQRILIVEDEPKIAQLVGDYLGNAGFAWQAIHDGGKALDSIAGYKPHLVILDIMLPTKSGLDICRELRQSSRMPVIMLTAKIEEIDRLIGLELGADDYICKPFSPREVIARVRTILRRTSPNPQNAAAPSADLVIDAERYQASLGGAMLNLTPVEFRLLQAMAASPGTVFSRDKLLDHIHEDHRIVTDRTVDTHVKNIRRKMETAAPSSDVTIHSIYGVGYKLE